MKYILKKDYDIFKWTMIFYDYIVNEQSSTSDLEH